MKKLVFLFFTVYLVAWSVVPANATTGAELTTQAKHIMWTELETEGVAKRSRRGSVPSREHLL